MEDAPPELKPSSLQGGKWVTYGMGIGLAGVLFLVSFSAPSRFTSGYEAGARQSLQVRAA